MTSSKTIAAMTVLAAATMLTTAAGAMPTAPAYFPGRDVVAQVRIVCEPFGRCFRIDPYGRRIFVPRPEEFERPGFGFGFGRRGFDDRDDERRRRNEPGFDERQDDRGGSDRRPKQGQDGMQQRQRQDQDGMQQRQRPAAGQSQGNKPPQGAGERQGNGQPQVNGQQQGNGQPQGNPQHRQGEGAGQQQGNGQNGQRRQRQPDDGNQ